ncbi:unannotated protein [freshwater metagenome]|uniref:Unannotated protein n=1 Tax=freshwater metagenome TaxID=449393 RepID=A0A6J7ILY0_9ZZZZ|nr:methyltransferase domain-containing protein [Actinomycetota bacterium]
MSSRIDAVGRRLLTAGLERLTGGTLTLVEAGIERRFGDGLPDAAGRAPIAATVTVHDPRTWGRVLRETSTGLGLSYADGWWEADDLTAFLRLLSRNVRRADALLQPLSRITGKFADPIRRRRSPDRIRDRRNIRAHYDIGDDVFALFLDESRMYSCAIFQTPETTLAQAQRAKLERICTQLELGPDDHLLEIGTGWGGLAVHAAREHGCRVTTTTISDRQFAYATELVAREGLADRITVLHEHYRDLTGTYDRLVSVEMIEAVDWREYDDFLGACGRLVRPGGRMVLQAITIPEQRFDRAKVTQDFIKEVIFPGGCLPSTEAILHATGRTGDLLLVDLHDIGLDYAQTLRIWRTALLERSSELPALGLGDHFARTFEFYFRYCEAGFDERVISDVQLTFERPGG